MTAPQPGLITRLGPTGIAAAVTGILVLFGLGAVIIPALAGGGGDTSTAAPAVTPSAAAPPAAPSSAPPASEPPAPSPTTATTTLVAANFNTGYEDRVVQLINNERRKEKCDPMRVDAKLRAAARGHAADMAAGDFTGAKGSDGSSPRDRAQAAGFGGFEDELTAKGGDPGDVVKHWMRDDDAQDLLLDCDITSIGVGAALRGRTPYWTVDTGRA
ncbi:CAP domain-containing protein [Dactylosporangium sp. NPDC051541]|uniref:CAP domain-containing protein n=1 Tax=Dactylosporangium sp. NPDC051541 TaxID=3363977 RepID=UPI0037B58E23